MRSDAFLYRKRPRLTPNTVNHNIYSCFLVTSNYKVSLSDECLSSRMQSSNHYLEFQKYVTASKMNVLQELTSS